MGKIDVLYSSTDMGLFITAFNRANWYVLKSYLNTHLFPTGRMCLNLFFRCAGDIKVVEHDMCGTQVRFLAWPVQYNAGAKVDKLANGPATHMMLKHTDTLFSDFISQLLLNQYTCLTVKQTTTTFTCISTLITMCAGKGKGISNKKVNFEIDIISFPVIYYTSRYHF